MIIFSVLMCKILTFGVPTMIPVFEMNSLVFTLPLCKISHLKPSSVFCIYPFFQVSCFLHHLHNTPEYQPIPSLWTLEHLHFFFSQSRKDIHTWNSSEDYSKYLDNLEYISSFQVFNLCYCQQRQKYFKIVLKILFLHISNFWSATTERQFFLHIHSCNNCMVLLLLLNVS